MAVTIELSYVSKDGRELFLFDQFLVDEYLGELVRRYRTVNHRDSKVTTIAKCSPYYSSHHSLHPCG